MIRKLTPSDSKSTASIHYQAMRNEFLPGFGKNFLTTLHEQIILSPLSISLGFFSHKKLIGFIIGSIDTNKLMGQVLKDSKWHLLPFVIKKIITSPKTLIRLYETITYGKNNDKSKAELIIIAVNRSTCRQGIGTKLLQSLCQEFKNRNVKSLSVGTTEENKVSNMFYKKHGGKYLYSHKLYGRKWNVYEFNII